MRPEYIKLHLTQMLNTLVQAFPVEYQETIKNNAYFAGGCVVDLVRDETPRDYDVFLKTEEAAVAVRSSFEGMAGASIPGGTCKAVTDNAVTLVLTSADGEPRVFQIITRFYGPTERVFKTFDYTHCKSYFDPQSAELSYNEDIIRNKVLDYDGEKDEFTLNTLKRMCKFVSRGWVPNNQTIINLHKAIQRRPSLDDPEEHKKQSIGFYGSSFT